MTADIAITLGVILAAMALFVWNRIPAAVVAVLASLALFVTGVISAPEMLGGFGDPVVIFIAALLGIAVALENAGVGAWASQLLMRRAGSSDTTRLIAIMVVAAVFSGLIGMNGAVAAMLPVVVIVAVRTRTAPSLLMIPLAFACLTGAKLTLLGTPVNVIAATQAEEAGAGEIGFFEWSLVGLPQLVGTIAIVVLLGRRLLPERQSQAIPADFSAHAQTLVEEFRLREGLHRLRVRDSSPLLGSAPGAVGLAPYRGLVTIAAVEPDGTTPLRRELREGDLLLVRGDAEEVGRAALDLHLAIRADDDGGGDGDGHGAPVADVLLSRDSGLAEVVVPPRSALVGKPAFPGMVTDDGSLLVLAVQRGGTDLRAEPVELQAGDHLLLRGTWQALDSYLADPQVLVVDSPEVVKRQTVALGRGAPAALAILGLLIVLLAFDLVPAAVAAVVCATLMVVARVVSLPQLYRGIDWNTVVLIGAMIPPAIAMGTTGAATLIGDLVVGALGAGGPYAVLTGVFLASALVSQFISNTSTALVMMPIGLATAAELGVAGLPMVMAVAMGASASFMTPFANGVSLMVYGPGGYRFGDFWRIGTVVLVWKLAVTVVVVPLVWPF
ncbi:SLC13 family permease [Promicromonospora kroppenstedtii]|uniref:SLC13 family permease n=1 Tax=Promicromonospora kroppenstedtii TaxID=440482 RepID=UPI0004B2C159|nr:SLC13 family permease [Promicromonospora kroppenstedtii]